MNFNPKVSIVIPVYNEEEALPELFRELERVCAGTLHDAGPVEIVLVDDGSTDRSWARIAARCDRAHERSEFQT